MKAYFFKYPGISSIVQASFPITKTFGGKVYRIEENLEQEHGPSEILEVSSESSLFFVRFLEDLVDIDLASSGYPDFDNVAKNIRKRNDGKYEVMFITDRSRELYLPRLQQMQEALDRPKEFWFKPTNDFKIFLRFVTECMNKVSDETACIVVIST